METKSLKNTNIADVKETTPDVVVFGDGDQWKLLMKASSAEQGWMKSTKVMEVGGAPAPMGKKKPTMDELEAILNAGGDPGVEIRPDGEMVSKDTPPLGCLVQVTTEFRKPQSGKVTAAAEAVVFVPGAKLSDFNFPE